ncbi:MAG: DUF420 domain-containing protein, partial [Planctomycetota bacterium]
SYYQVRFNRNLKLHRRIQIGLVSALTVALVLFEVDVRFYTDWRELARPSPYFESGLVQGALWIHLLFAIPTPLIWATLLLTAILKFDQYFEPQLYRATHRKWGRVAVAMMLATAITGWMFYWLAFVA